jgi:hypothetical protein
VRTVRLSLRRYAVANPRRLIPPRPSLGDATLRKSCVTGSSTTTVSRSHGATTSRPLLGPGLLERLSPTGVPRRLRAPRLTHAGSAVARRPAAVRFATQRPPAVPPSAAVQFFLSEAPFLVGPVDAERAGENAQERRVAQPREPGGGLRASRSGRCPLHRREHSAQRRVETTPDAGPAVVRGRFASRLTVPSCRVGRRGGLLGRRSR